MAEGRERIAGTRILCIPSSAGLSHLHRLLLIAGELRRRGHVTAFAFGGPREAYAGTEHEWFSVREPQLDDFQSNLFATFADDRAAARCLEDQRNAIERFGADVVVADLHPVASIAARLAGRPLVSVLNGYLTEYFDVTGLFIDRDERRTAWWCADWLIRLILFAQKRALAAPFRRLARSSGIGGAGNLYRLLAGDLTLVADMPEFCPLRRPPPHHRFIGPLIWDGHPRADAPAARLKDGRVKCLYVTIGNTGGRALLDLAARTFGGHPDYHVTITTGAYVDASGYQRHANIHARRFIPGSLVMRACDLAIHCGGNGTTYQCLANGLPAIAVPFNNDQRINARLLQKSGAGIHLDPRPLESERLRQAVDYVLAEPRFRRASLSFSAKLSPRAGPARAADAILAAAGEPRRQGGGDRATGGVPAA